MDGALAGNVLPPPSAQPQLGGLRTRCVVSAPGARAKHQLGPKRRRRLEPGGWMARARFLFAVTAPLILCQRRQPRAETGRSPPPPRPWPPRRRRRRRRPSPHPPTASGPRPAWRGPAGRCTRAWPGGRPGRPGPGERLAACRFPRRRSAGSRRHPTPPPSPRCLGFTASKALPARPVRLRHLPRVSRWRPAPARGHGHPATPRRGRKSPAAPGPRTRRHGPRGWPKKSQPWPRPPRPGLGRGAAALASRSPRTLAAPRAARPRPPPCWPPSCATRLAA